MVANVGDWKMSLLILILVHSSSLFIFKFFQVFFLVLLSSFFWEGIRTALLDLIHRLRGCF